MGKHLVNSETSIMEGFCVVTHHWLPRVCYVRISSHSNCLFFFCYLQGKTPQERAQQAGDPDLAAYLESRQNYKIIGHEDLETAV